MDRSSLLQYVGAAKDLESALFAHEQIEKGARAKAPTEPPKPQKRYVGQRPSKPEASGGTVAACIIGWIFIAILGFAADSFLLKLLGIIMFIGCIISAAAGSSNRDTSYTQSLRIYNSAVAQAESEYSRDMTRYDQDLQRYHSDQMAFQKNVVALLCETKTELQQSLDTLYSADIIFPKYRNLVAVSAIYEYLSSGRCDRLDGPDGAYNLYEMELRQNIIIGQLSAILSNLEQIRASQYTLYQEITSANIKSFDLLCNLEKQSALIAYNSEVSAKCSEALTCMHLFR